MLNKFGCRLDRRLRKMSHDLGISRSSVQRCVRMVLRNKAFELGTVVAFTDVTRKNRYKKCLLLYRLLAMAATEVDETPVYVQEPYCPKNYRAWTTDRRTLSRRKFGFRVLSIRRSCMSLSLRHTTIDFSRKRRIHERQVVPRDSSTKIS